MPCCLVSLHTTHASNGYTILKPKNLIFAGTDDHFDYDWIVILHVFMQVLLNGS